MECSDGANDGDVEVVDDILGPEDLSNDGANDSDGEVVDDILDPEDLFNDEDVDGQNGQNDLEIVQGEKDIKEKIDERNKPTKTVKNSRVTINYNTLKGDNGLGTLKKLFTNFKFKGNGHEKEDLGKIMGILQQWMCYKLCPSYDFESCMLYLESIGKRRAVQVLMKRYRLGMEDWGECPIVENLTDENNQISEESSKNSFDILLEEEMAKIGSDDDILEADEEISAQNNQQSTQMEFEGTLTSEQLERIARNRQLAEERRLKKMKERSEVTEVNQSEDQELFVKNINLEENS